ncbi:Hypothetical protein ORPV_1067 [Orpheovirus IHUMI-LCC2]|uniref:Uncharacterized protein n=1 Tax=Orpheovirus IHUMI-LCC2 TaxID=2023057 RepID=A0A2I2L628_9VIRU|nr:Hypothetical protein ORPV_1067 [Orpheovirus IHUMI-LCC2]SNW62971.1 Hypothetical protein ORPV_1067 [Orpheovirus IHUMI-LCC2]
MSQYHSKSSSYEKACGCNGKKHSRCGNKVEEKKCKNGTSACCRALPFTTVVLTAVPVVGGTGYTIRAAIEANDGLPGPIFNSLLTSTSNYSPYASFYPQNLPVISVGPQGSVQFTIYNQTPVPPVLGVTLVGIQVTGPYIIKNIYGSYSTTTAGADNPYSGIFDPVNNSVVFDRALVVGTTEAFTARITIVWDCEQGCVNPCAIIPQPTPGFPGTIVPPVIIPQ